MCWGGTWPLARSCQESGTLAVAAAADSEIAAAAMLTVHYCRCCYQRDTPLPFTLTGPCWFGPGVDTSGHLMPPIYRERN